PPVRTHPVIRSERRVGDQGTDTQTTVDRFDPVIAQARKIDEPYRLLDFVLHQVDQVRPACQVAISSARLERRQLFDSVRTFKVEWFHRLTTSSIAETILGYAPQRQRLPLI